MQLQCDISLAEAYTSKAQQSRILSEAWFASNGYCLACDNNRLEATRANTKATDFTCQVCNHRYELKTFQIKPKRTLIDGAYSTMMARIMDGTAPTLMLLERDNRWTVQALTAIHHTFLTPEVVAQRKPLSATARRAGWIGCNIRLDLIIADAQISLIGGGKANEPKSAREAFQRYEPLGKIGPGSRGWTTMTLRVIRSLGSNRFSLGDVYRKQHLFAAAFPNNRNVLPKIRQQLQVLRDLGFLRFLGNGNYELLNFPLS